MKRFSFAALFALVASLLVPASPAFAAAAVLVDKPNGYVTAGSTVTVPMSVTGLTWTTVDVLITSVSGDVTIADPGSTLTLSTGYTSLTGTELSFYGSAAAVSAALANGFSWTAPSTPAASILKFKLTLREHVDGQVVNPGNGHTYKYVQASSTNWNDSKTGAEALTVDGHTGYLATITSDAENTFVANKTGASNVWVGATSNEAFLAALSPSVTGNKNNCNYYWGVGPEAGTGITTGCSGSRAPVGSNYNSFATGEPNNSGGNEDCIVTNWNGVAGKWNDLTCTRTSGISGYLVEFDTDAVDAVSYGLVYDNNNGSATDTALGAPVNPLLPGPPVNPTVTVDASGTATISWTAPSTGGTPASYLVTASPGGATCTVAHPATSCTIPGAANGATYSVTAVNATGSSSASAPTTPIDIFSVTATKNSATATQIASGDRLSVKTHAPIGYTGPATQTITTLFSNQSLSLASTSDITRPAGWNVEYTTDGMNWSATAPGNLGTVAGIRTTGDVNALEGGLFTSSAEAESTQQASTFTANSGGDGFNVGFGNGILLNSYHHTLTTTISCHNLDGTSCGSNYVATGYESGQNSSVWVDKSNNHLYQFVRKALDGHYGILCVDYTDPTAPAACSTPFVSLSNGYGTGASPSQWADSGGYHNGMGSPWKDGTKLWSIDAASNTLLCFDMATQAACPTDNGFSLGGTPNFISGTYLARVAARDGIVFFSIENKMGCYDSTTHALCGGNAPIIIGGSGGGATGANPAANSSRAIPVLIENTSGTFVGACDAYSRLCLKNDGTSMTIPTALSAFWTNATTRPNLYIAGVDALVYAVSKHRLYWGGPQTGDYWSKNMTCYDFTTQAACAGYTASTSVGITEYYSATIDPDNSKCVWVNQNSGSIIPINAATGAVGCSLGGAKSVTVPISANVSRMACDAAGKVLTWDTLTVNLPSDIAPANVTVSINDSSDTPIPGWQNLTIDATGVIDISTLDVSVSGTDPIVHIDADPEMLQTDLVDTTADVTFSASQPELCVVLNVATNCPNITPSGSDVPDGKIKGESVTVPVAEVDSITADKTITVPGTNTGNVCAAILPGNPPDPPVNPQASPGDGKVTVSWTEPTGGSGGAPTSYTVTDESGLYSCTVNAPATSCEVTGLTNASPYVFHVVATNPSGDSDPSSNTVAVIPAAPYVANTLTVYFTSISPKLSPYAKTLITNFMNDHRFKKVTCTGSTQGLETIVWLAKSRAVNSCAFATGVKKVTTQSAITTNKGIRAPYRAVVLVGK